MDLLYVDAATRLEDILTYTAESQVHVRFTLLVSESSADGAHHTTVHPNSDLLEVPSCEAAKSPKVVLPEER